MTSATRMDTKTYFPNFSVENMGYQIMYTALTVNFPLAVEAYFPKQKKLRFSTIFGVCEGMNSSGCYFAEDEYELIVNETIKGILDDASWAEANMLESYRLQDELFRISKKYEGMDFRNMTSRKLGLAYRELIDIICRSHGNALVLTWCLDSKGEAFSKLLIGKVKVLVSKSGKGIDAAEAFSTLTTKPKNSLQLVEEIELMKLLKMINADRSAKALIAGLTEFSSMPDGLDSMIGNAIMAHHNKWRWVPFTYIGPAYDIDYYLQILRGLIRENVDADAKIRELLSRPDNVAAQRAILSKELGIKNELMRVFDLAADIVFLKGYRKDAMFYSCYVLSNMYKEMAKRLYYAMNQMYLLTPGEIIGYFADGRNIDLNEVNRRMKLTVILYEHPGKRRVLTGKGAAEFLAGTKMIKEEVDTNVKELKGTTACSGAAKGVVKIVNNVEQMPKMQQGDIMISHTTFPALVPAMKKASAIVTEDGGITCHAAIVSREMKTPCITGVRGATMVFKDGDIVEVDAGAGIIRKAD